MKKTITLMFIAVLAVFAFFLSEGVHCSSAQAQSQTNPEEVPPMFIECPDCSGGRNLEACSHCDGSGKAGRTQAHPSGAIVPEAPCHMCMATGKNRTCQTCYGNFKVLNEKYVAYAKECQKNNPNPPLNPSSDQSPDAATRLMMQKLLEDPYPSSSP